MTILVTGGAGFIGGNFVLGWLAQSDEPVINLDALTYAGSMEILQSLQGDNWHHFVRGNICDIQLVVSLLKKYQPRAVFNFAAESHVDRSIHDPADFIRTNMVGTFHLLEAVRTYWVKLSVEEKEVFRFLHVSTDEVYGTLWVEESPSAETNRYVPNSPCSASKAASDHLILAWYCTYGLPVLTTNSSNNYGPYHFSEKMIPLMILNALSLRPLPIYGDGLQVRDWLYVGDHCSALRCVLDAGHVGQTYNVGGWNEKPNLEVVTTICTILDQLSPRVDRRSYAEQIAYVADRPRHDRRYAIDAGRLACELGWKPAETFRKWHSQNSRMVSCQSGVGYQCHEWRISQLA